MLLVSCIFVADGVKIGLQFGRKLEELAHGVRPGHADILVLEHEEIAIPQPGLFLPRSLFPRVPGQGYQYDRGVPHERVPQDSGRTVTNA